MNNIDHILRFWFGEQQNSNDPAYWQQINKRWFGSNADTDQLITKTFKPLLLQTENNELNSWESTAAGRLALIILTDQFSRNIFRSTKEAFCFDALALKHCLAGINAKQHLTLHPVQQVFFFMPLEHSENISDQTQCVELLQNLLDTSAPEMSNTLANFRDFAIKHLDIIAQFGRFPHRNAVLGRQSTPAEQAYLQADGATFGQG